MRTTLLSAVAFSMAVLGAAGAWSAESKVLVEGDHTIVGEPLVYPEGHAKMTTVVTTLAPGEKTGWHRHGVPLLGYIIEGELTVDYGPLGKRVYRAGDAVMEAIEAPHEGVNTGSGPMRVLVVFMGVEGKPNSVPVTEPK